MTRRISIVALTADDLDELYSRLETAEQLSSQGADLSRSVRVAAPVLRAALDTLPTVCRYHGDRLDPNRPAWGRGEACCDTGIPARRRRDAQTALALLTGNAVMTTAPPADTPPSVTAR